MRKHVLLLLLLVPFLVLGPSAWGDVTPPPPPAVGPPIPTLAGGALLEASFDVKGSADLYQVDQGMERAERYEAQLRGVDDGQVEALWGLSRDARGHFVERVELFKNTLSSIKVSLADRLRLEKEVAKLDQAPEGAQALPSPPYNLSFADAQKDRLEEIAKKKESWRTQIALGEQTLEALLDSRRAAEKEVRLLQDGAPGASPWPLNDAVLRRDIFRALRVLERLRLDNLKIEYRALESQEKRLTQTQQQIVAHLSFDEKDRDAQIGKYQGFMDSLRKEAENLLKQRQQNERALASAREQMARASGDRESRGAALRVAQREAELELTRQRLEHGALMKQVVGVMQGVWRNRYALLRGEIPAEALSGHLEVAVDLSQEIGKQVEIQQQEAWRLQKKLSSLQKELDNPDVPKDFRGIMEQTYRTVADLAEGKREFVSFLLENLGVAENAEVELRAALGKVSLAKKINVAWQEQFWSVWQMELWVADERPITVGKTVSAVLLTLGGIFANAYLSRRVAHRLERHFNVLPTSAMAVQRLTFYALMVATVLWALATVGIPLTAFAFLGGALAIGFGLGAQTFFSQIISGFLITIQKPIRIGDRIQIGDAQGKVVLIGSRYTRIRTFDNLDVLVPNEHFLSHPVTNWTLSSTLVRGSLSVKVSCTAPPKAVEEILMDSSARHDKILKKPAPFVRFSDFSEGHLAFDLFFWVDLAAVDPTEVAHDLRFALMKDFALRGIVLAQPRREVRLDWAPPPEGRRLPGDAGSEGGAPFHRD